MRCIFDLSVAPMDKHLSTEVLPIDPLNPDPDRVERAATLLRHGRLVAFPTETVYGLGANAFDADAVAGIFAAKQRPSSDPLIVHIAALNQLDDVATEVSAQALELAQRFWPGPLTLVLSRGDQIPANVSAGMNTVAVRMPDHPIAVALLQAAQVPIAAPSANRFTRPSPTQARHVLDDLAGRIDMVIDGGATPIGLESSIVSLVGPVPQLLRPGGVPIEVLRDALPDLVYEPRYLTAHVAAVAPGMMLKHYAPNAEVLLFRGPRAAVIERMRATAITDQAEDRLVGMLVADEDTADFADTPAIVVSLGSGKNLAEVGARLFAGLRELEGRAARVILVRAFEQQGLGLAIWDRLVRATEGRIIDVGT